MKTQQNSRNTESSGIGAFIAAICIVIYLFALVQASVRIYLDVENRKIVSDEEFSNIAVIAMSAGTYGFMDDRFMETMNNALFSSKTIEALIITGPEDVYAIEKQKGRAITWVNNSPRFLNRISFSNQNHYRALPIQDLRNANIKAVSGAFDYYELSKILKETLLLILLGFAVAFFTMLVQLLLGKSGEAETANAYVSTSASTTGAVRETVYARESVSAIETAPAEKYTEREIQREDVETEPKGLYSPRSNIGWEEYINDRLDSELHRCASTEKDLVLILMEFTDIKTDAAYRQAAEEAVSFFTSRDLLFEFGDHGIAVILPGIDLDTGLSKSEIFFQRVTQKFKNGGTLGLCIGLSSRAGRLLNADRLIMESSAALSKARKDPKSSLVAFKSDPEKYRAFIASQN